MSIYKKLAKKYGIDEKEIKKLCESPFKLMREEIKQADFNEDVGDTLNFNIKYLGMFHVCNRRREAIKKKINGFKNKRS